MCSDVCMHTPHLLCSGPALSLRQRSMQHAHTPCLYRETAMLMCMFLFSLSLFSTLVQHSAFKFRPGTVVLVC